MMGLRRATLKPSQEAEYYIDMATDLMCLHQTILRLRRAHLISRVLDVDTELRFATFH